MMKLAIFNAGEGSEPAQEAFYERLDNLLFELHRGGYEPDDVHSFVQDRRGWMAIVKEPA